jgi:hypothetical protein
MAMTQCRGQHHAAGHHRSAVFSINSRAARPPDTSTMPLLSVARRALAVIAVSVPCLRSTAKMRHSTIGSECGRNGCNVGARTFVDGIANKPAEEVAFVESLAHELGSLNDGSRRSVGNIADERRLGDQLRMVLK